MPVGSGSGGADSALLVQRPGGGGGGGVGAAARAAKVAGRPPLPHGGNSIVDNNLHSREGNVGIADPGGTTSSPGLGLEGEWEGAGGGDDAGGGADDVSLAGLSLASGNSMQYSVDSG